MTDIIFDAELIFGTVELVKDRKIEDGKLWLGGHAIHRDRSGVITRVTEPEYYCSMESREPND